MKNKILMLLFATIMIMQSCKKETITPAPTPPPTVQQPSGDTMQVTFKQSQGNWFCDPYYNAKSETVKIAHTYNEIQTGVFIDQCTAFQTTFTFKNFKAGVYWYKSEDLNSSSITGCANTFTPFIAIASFTVSPGVNQTIIIH